MCNSAFREAQGKSAVPNSTAPFVIPNAVRNPTFVVSCVVLSSWSVKLLRFAQQDNPWGIRTPLSFRAKRGISRGLGSVRPCFLSGTCLVVCQVASLRSAGQPVGDSCTLCHSERSEESHEGLVPSTLCHSERSEESLFRQGSRGKRSEESRTTITKRNNSLCTRQ